ncbi:MAG: hypothetical protein JWP89_64 [Schlesneria sp.]|nr:hypothetical protein [Schlesneria sp.]
MRLFQNRHSQILPERLTAKIGHPRKTLPWTDKLCHFVSFEAAVAPPQSGRQRSCIMRPRLCHALSRFPVAHLAKRLGGSPSANKLKRQSPEVLATSATKTPRFGQLCHALSVPWLPALSPQLSRSVGCVMRYQGISIRRFRQLCHATSAQSPASQFARAKLPLSRDQRAESKFNHGSAGASQRSSVERITHAEVPSVVSCAVSENPAEGSVSCVMHLSGSLPLSSSN